MCSLGSSYGPGTWDSPCTTLGDDESITVTATYGITLSGPAVDFSPALRFSPDAQVTLSTSLYSGVLTSASDYFASHPSALRFFGMYYEPNLGSTLVTDAALDPSLVTHVNLNTGIVWRRVKHFSGYTVDERSRRAIPRPTIRIASKGRRPSSTNRSSSSRDHRDHAIDSERPRRDRRGLSRSRMWERSCEKSHFARPRSPTV